MIGEATELARGFSTCEIERGQASLIGGRRLQFKGVRLFCLVEDVEALELLSIVIVVFPRIFQGGFSASLSIRDLIFDR